MKLKTVVLVPAVIGLVAYAVIKGYLYYQVKSDLDRLSSMLAPFAVFEYDAISTGLVEGSVAVEGVTITPGGSTESITVDRLELAGDGFGFLLGVASGLRPEQPPERLQLSFQRIRTPVSADYLAAWTPPTRGSQPQTCSLGGLLAQQELERLGFQQLVADGLLRYRFTPHDGQLSLQMDLLQHGLSRSRFEAELGGLQGPAAVAAGAPVQLRRLSFSFQFEPGYLQRAIDDCAAQEGLDRQAYIDRMLAADDATLAANLGFVPGTGLRFALRQMVSEAAELVIDAAPDAPFNPAQLSVYTPQQLLRVLGVSLRVNRQTISDLSFTLPSDSQMAGLLDQGARVGDPSATAGQSTQPDAPQRPRARYIDTPLVQLGRYVGRDVRIHTSDRPEPQKGILVAVGEDQLDLEQRLYGGSMTRYIPLREVRQVEVYRRVE